QLLELQPGQCDAAQGRSGLGRAADHPVRALHEQPGRPHRHGPAPALLQLRRRLVTLRRPRRHTMHTSSRGRPLHAWVRFAILLALAGCREATAPLDRQTVVGPQISQSAATDIPIVQQAATAPSPSTYRVSLWARHDRQATVTVNYRSGQPFLHFHIPKFGLMWGPDETRLRGGDSILITLTTAPRPPHADFQPAGTAVSEVHAAPRTRRCAPA